MEVDVSLEALLSRRAAEMPDHPAMLEGDLRVSYRDLDRRVTEFAVGLVLAGVEAGNRVALLLEGGGRVRSRGLRNMARRSDLGPPEPADPRPRYRVRDRTHTAPSCIHRRRRQSQARCRRRLPHPSYSNRGSAILDIFTRTPIVDFRTSAV